MAVLKVMEEHKGAVRMRLEQGTKLELCAFHVTAVIVLQLLCHSYCSYLTQPGRCGPVAILLHLASNRLLHIKRGMQVAVLLPISSMILTNTSHWEGYSYASS